MGKISKGTKCSIIDCNEFAIRSISSRKVKSVGLNIPESRRTYLCEKHYKEYKKGGKRERRFEKWRRNV